VEGLPPGTVSAKQNIFQRGQHDYFLFLPDLPADLLSICLPSLLLLLSFINAK
jgi:hypothetical protein